MFDDFKLIIIGIIIGFVIGIIVACIGIASTTIYVGPKPIKANLTVFDGGVDVMTFDNATLLPSKGRGLSFTCMDTEYAYTGKMLIEVLK